MNYIGFEDSLSLTNPPAGDVYDFMAGGLFDGYYAGGYGYNALNLPGADLRSFFINQTFSLTAGLLNFNENFCEFVLMPMQIMILRDEKDHSLNALIKTVEKIAEKKRDANLNKRDSGGENSYAIDGNGYINFGGFKEFARELINDSLTENAAENLGRLTLGPIGGAIAGMVYDGLVNNKFQGANIAETLYGELKNLALNTAIRSGLNALGTSTGLIGGLALTTAINSFVSEIFETAAGLDNSFGFGGDLVGFMKDKAVYQEKLGFADGVKNIFGRLDFYRTVDYEGNTLGYVQNGRMYEYTNYPTVADAMRGLGFSKLESAEAEGLKEPSEIKGGYNSKFSTGVRVDRYGNISFELSMRKDTGFRGNFQDVLDDIVKSNVFGVAPSIDIKSIVETVTATQTTAISVQAGMEGISSEAMKESFLRDSAGSFSFSNTQAGNLVEAMGKVGFGKGHLSIEDMAKAMDLAKKLGNEKSGSNRDKGKINAGGYAKDKTSKAGGTGFDTGGFNGDGTYDSGSYGNYGKKSGGSNRDKSSGNKSSSVKNRTATEHSRAQRGRSYRSRQSRNSR